MVVSGGAHMCRPACGRLFNPQDTTKHPPNDWPDRLSQLVWCLLDDPFVAVLPWFPGVDFPPFQRVTGPVWSAPVAVIEAAPVINQRL